MFLNVFISISIMHSEPNPQEIFFNPNEELNLLCSTLVRPYLEHCVPSLVQEMELKESTAAMRLTKGQLQNFLLQPHCVFCTGIRSLQEKEEGERRKWKSEKKNWGQKREEKNAFRLASQTPTDITFVSSLKGHNHIQKREMCVWFCLCLFCFWQWLEGLEVVCLIDFKSSVALPPSKSYHELHMNYTVRQHQGQSCVCF